VTEYPEAFLAEVPPDFSAGTTSFVICLEEDLESSGCTTAASMILTYFPAGVGWQCEPPEGSRACNPDYSDAHDSSVARLVREPNHQMNDDYVDAPPIYRD
jgi:hypothetical protein